MAGLMLSNLAVIEDPVLIFALVLSMLLLAPLLSRHLRVPSLIILILAGLVVGPHGLRWLARDATFELLGTVGLLYLMFLAGLEIDMNEFRRNKHHSFVFGALTFLFPQVAGAVLAFLLFGYSWTTAILLASMFASHTLIPYPIVSRLGLARSRAVTATVGGTIFTDTAALLVLAVIAEAHTAELSGAFWIRALVLLALLVVGVLFGVQRLGYWFFRHVGQEGTLEYIFVMAMAFLSAYAAELAGVEPIIGAFLAGLAFSPLVPDQSPLMLRIRFVGEALFIPFFLLSVGMLIDLSVLATSLRSWLVCLFMLICVTVCKWLAAMLSGALLKYDREERYLVFGLSVNQAAATLAAVLVGYRLGIFDEEVMNGTIMMILGTCIIGPWVTDVMARRMSLREVQSVAAGQREDRILIPVGKRENINPLIEVALLMRDDKSRQPLLPLQVVGEDVHVEKQMAGAERMLSHAVVRALSADVPVTPVTRIDLNVAGGILRAAREMHATKLVMGWDPKQARTYLLQHGNIPDRVAAGSHQMLALCRFDYPLNAMTGLWCVVPLLIERHPGFTAAIRQAHGVAKRMGAAAFHLVGEARAIEQAAEVLGSRAAPAPKIHPIEHWEPVPAPLRASREEADMVLLLNVRRGGLAWQPALERLPQQLVRERPRQNIMILYLPEHDASEPDYSEMMDAEGLADLTGGEGRRILLSDLSDVPLEAVPRRLLETYFKGRSEALLEAEQMLRTNPDPLQLAPGVALLHVHCRSIDEPVVLVGLCRNGWQDEGGGVEPLRVLFFLLSVRDQPPERHLEMLYRIARFVKQGRLEEVAPWLKAEGAAQDKSPPVEGGRE